MMSSGKLPGSSDDAPCLAQAEALGSIREKTIFESCCNEILLWYSDNVLRRYKEMKKDTLAKKVASFVYATAALNQSENDWLVCFEEIGKRFPSLKEGWEKDEEFLKAVQDELYEYKGCDGEADTAEITEDGFDMTLWTDYIADEYEAE